mmetsp:Transcript_56390/g.82461  ORF Transcript_56390/g.82461 Transcript_56390/m.82461 type:complete len:88 (+) Transcript_56390:85-348(+)
MWLGRNRYKKLTALIILLLFVLYWAALFESSVVGACVSNWRGQSSIKYFLKHSSRVMFLKVLGICAGGGVVELCLDGPLARERGGVE